MPEKSILRISNGWLLLRQQELSVVCLGCTTNTVLAKLIRCSSRELQYYKKSHKIGSYWWWVLTVLAYCLRSISRHLRPLTSSAIPIKDAENNQLSAINTFGIRQLDFDLTYGSTP